MHTIQYLIPQEGKVGLSIGHQVDQVGLDIGQLQHYRGDCDPETYVDCEERFLRNTTKDISLWKWKDEVIRKSSNVLNELGFI